jgi:hypothetical protein
MWVRFHDQAPDEMQVIVSKGGVFSVALSSSEYETTLHLFNGLSHTLITDVSKCDDGKAFLAKGKWQHISVAYGIDGILHHYINGRHVHSKKLNRGVPLISTNTPINMGNVHIHLDDIMMFDGALSAVRITSLFDLRMRSLVVSNALQRLPLQYIQPSAINTAPALLGAVVDFSVAQPLVNLTFSEAVACPFVRIQNLRFELGSEDDDVLVPTALTARIAHCHENHVIVYFSDILAAHLQQASDVVVRIYPAFPAATELPSKLSAAWFFDSVDTNEDTSVNGFHFFVLD